jgi:hypothetical protein
VTISIDELSSLAGEEYRAKDEAERKRREARKARERTKDERFIAREVLDSPERIAHEVVQRHLPERQREAA